jgi:uncharacterized protein (TIGR02145 family)
MRRRTLLNASNDGFDPTTRRKKIGGYEVVDLGLASGLLWATCNVGATKETEYGDYYKYGKGSQKYNYGDDTYEGTEDPLDLSVDTAAQVMGYEWRMPTQAELQDLIYGTNYSWATINGVKGGKFTSKTNPNAYVFFPAAGEYRAGSILYVGTDVYLWSSSSCGVNSARYMYSYNNNNGVNCEARSCGLSVRGVYE